MLERLWSAAGTKFLVAMVNGKPHHMTVPDHYTVDKVLDEYKRYDLYFAPAVYNDASTRSQGNVKLVQGFWLDIDAGEGKPYEDWRAAQADLQRFLHDTGLAAPTHIVLSGYGLHVYWVLSEPIERDRWYGLASRLKRLCQAKQLYADGARTADSASIMRLPGTFNHKSGEPKPVILRGSDRLIDVRDFERSLPALGPQRVVGRQDAGEWSTQPTYPPGHAPTIAAKCAQMRHVYEAGGEVDEPRWRAALSIIYRCEDGENLIHEWSKGDPRYNAQETAGKAARTAGPATCQWWQDHDPVRCEECPWAGKITSPIQLGVGVEAEPAAEVDSGDGYFRPARIGDFIQGQAGIFMSPAEPGERPVRVADCRFYVLEVRERARQDNEPDRSSLLVEWTGTDGRTRRGALPQSVVYEHRTFVQWLADHNIRAQIRDTKAMAALISEMTGELLRRRAVRTFYETLGWYDSTFILGPKAVTAEGIQPALVQSSSPISQLEPAGTLEAWKAGVEELSRPGLEPHQFTILCGFASPLLHHAGVTSAVVSLSGRSGYGKTLAARAALSIYGAPNYLMQAASATNNAIEDQLGRHRHVPYLLDEVTNMKPARLAELIYTMANGQGKSTMTRTREQRARGMWALVPILTGNHPLLEMEDDTIEEAHRRRLLEVTFDTRIDAAAGAAVDHAITHNVGVAAQPYLQCLASHQSKLEDMFTRAQRRVRELCPEIPDANRHSLWTLAGCYLGGHLARSLGLISFDPDQAITQVINELKENVAATYSEEERVRDGMMEFLTTYSRHVCHWKQGDQFSTTMTDDPVARIIGPGLVAVHSVRWKAYASARKLNIRAVRHWWNDVVLERRALRLSPNTQPVYTLLISLDRMGVGEDFKPISVNYHQPQRS